MLVCPEQFCSETFATANDRDRHFRTVHSNGGERPYRCLRAGCPANVTSWTNPEKLRAHNNSWHGPYPCSVLGCSRGMPHGFGSQQDLDDHSRTEHGEYSPSSSRESGLQTFSKPVSVNYGRAYDAMDTMVSQMAQTTVSSDEDEVDHKLVAHVSTRNTLQSSEKFDPRK